MERLLDYAICYRKKEVIKFLIDNNTDKSVFRCYVDDIVYDKEWTELIEYLYDNNFDINNFDINIEDSSGNTLLIHALKNDDFELVQ